MFDAGGRDERDLQVTDKGMIGVELHAYAGEGAGDAGHFEANIARRAVIARAGARHPGWRRHWCPGN